MHSGVTDYFYKEDHITFYEQHLFTASNGKKKDTSPHLLSLLLLSQL